MIYLFHGSDAVKVRAKAFAFVRAARTKAPDAPYVRLDASEISASTLAHAVSAQGLFYKKSLVLIDDPFASAESAEVFLENLDLLVESENPIVVLAPKLIATRVKKLESRAEKVFVVDAVKAPNRDGFNSALVNALGAKDGKVLWKEITKALRKGDAPEAVHGLLHWKARDLMQKGSPRWGKNDARTLSRELIELLSDSRGKDLELSLALERFALSLS